MKSKYAILELEGEDLLSAYLYEANKNPVVSHVFIFFFISKKQIL